VKRVHTLTPERAGDSEQRNLAVESHSRPSSRPFVLNQPHLMTSIMFRVEVDTLILCRHFSSINGHLLWLIVKFVPLHEAIGRGDTPEANHCPNIF
jgi:hypothetical protein